MRNPVKRFNKLNAMVMLLVLSCTANVVLAADNNLPTSTYMSVGSATSVPIGWLLFCGDVKGCSVGKLTPVDARLNEKTLKVIRSVNDLVNSYELTARGVNSVEVWGYAEHGAGTVALEKRRQLISIGFPRQALLLTVVVDKKGQYIRDRDDIKSGNAGHRGHLVLTVKTDRGDFILDDIVGDILPWAQTSYRPLKRQAQDDENVWLLVGDPTPQ